jgi:quercetin dioxygenase-like cupin family protein/ribosome-associated toxin RatA of RatAB toxin-antitoxin module
VSAHTDNAVDIAAPIDLVWRLTNDLERWPQLFTEYAAVEILERDGTTVRFRLTMHPDGQGNAWSWVSERTLDPVARRVTARRLEPGWFQHMDITWTYEATASGTRMRWVQDFSMRPDSPVDEAAMTRRIDDNSRVQMDHIRAEVERQAATPAPAVVRAQDVPANRRRGGDVRTVLSPGTVGSTSGFTGTVTVQPGEVVTEHYHPYSEEFLVVVAGRLTVRLDGVDHIVEAGAGVFIPIGVKHRLRNAGDEPAVAVFSLSPLAPRPELGHVDTEEHPAA